MNIQEKLALLVKVKEERKLLLQQLHDQSNINFIPLYTNTDRYLVLKGGGGSGKSIFAGRKILERIINEQGHRILVCRKVAKTLRESCFQQLKGQISEHYNSSDFNINKTDMHITYTKNGNELIFAGLDDNEKLKSIYNVTSIWIEEASELEIEDFRQLDIRLRGETKNYKQMIISFNPVSITHWLKTEFFDVVKLDCTTHESTYKDNRFLDDAAIKVLEGFKDTDPYYYMVYCQGEWGVLGKTVFDAEKVTSRLIALKQAKIARKGRIEHKEGKYTFIDDANGLWTIYKQPDEICRYAIGADVAEGNQWGDYDAAHIMDTATYEQCAVFHGHVDVDTYAEELMKGGHYYNKALICPEVNFNPGLVLNLERQKYPRIYLRQAGDSITHDVQLKYGFRTDKYNRQAIISDLVEFVRDHTIKLNDIGTLEEMLTFVRDDRGKPMAQQGKHDDLVMAFAIGLHVCMSGQGGRYIKDIKIDISKLPPDCQDDYYKADEVGKKRLELKWGLRK
jgi:phage terminase large subunit